MLRDKVTEFFVLIDDFRIDFEIEIKKYLLVSTSPGKRRRASSLSDAEIMSILLLFHYGQFSNFKSYSLMIFLKFKG